MNSKIEMEFDHRMNLALILTCPMCNHKNRKRLQDLQPNSQLKCSCGYHLNVNANDLKDLNRSVNDLKSSLTSFSKHL